MWELDNLGALLPPPPQILSGDKWEPQQNFEGIIFLHVENCMDNVYAEYPNVVLISDLVSEVNADKSKVER